MNLDNEIERLDAQVSELKQTRRWMNKVQKAADAARHDDVVGVEVKPGKYDGFDLLGKAIVEIRLGESDPIDILARMNCIGALEMSGFQFTRSQDLLKVNYTR